MHLGFDSLRGDDHAERVSHVDGGRHDGVVGGALAQSGDERAVDLELVERIAAQIHERRPTGAEIVDGEPEPDLLQCIEHFGRRFLVVEQHVLGDLEAQRRRLEMELVEQRTDHAPEVGAQQLTSGDVGGDAQLPVLRSLGARPARPLTHLLENPRSDRHDEAGLFRDLDEVGWRNQTADGMRPAEQRLVGDAFPRRQLELRLEQHPELFALERLA